MQTASFILSLVGAVSGALSLGWNIAQWLLSGARPRVELVLGAVAGDGSGMAVGPLPPDPHAALARLQREGLTRPVIGVKVVNRGRAPARVQRWSIECLGSDVSFVPVRDSIGPDLPHDLPAGANATWVTDLRNAAALAHAAPPVGPRPKRVTVAAELGTGKVLVAPQALRPESSPPGR